MAPPRRSTAPVFGFLFLVLLASSGSIHAQTPTVYDAFRDFSWVSNPTPGGVWSYGFTSGLGGPLNLYTTRISRFGLSNWVDPTLGVDPNVIKNETGIDVIYDQGILFPGSDFLTYHPGAHGEFSVVRWTAPAAGLYLLDSTMKNARDRRHSLSATTDVHILSGGQEIFSGLINDYDDQLSFSAIIEVGAGENVEFAVGFGANRAYQNDTSGLRARLTRIVPTECVPDPTTLCLNSGRFEVKTTWTTRRGESGPGLAVALTIDTGYFTFFDSANVEMIVKVLNGCGLNSHFWTFAGGLTDVDVLMTVRDTVTGEVKTYANPQGTPFQPIQDTSAFGTCLAANRGRFGTEFAASQGFVSSPEISEGCTPDATTLCLNNARYKVQSQWFTRDGASGPGRVIPLTSDTGAFWFFSEQNVELVLKVLNGCGVNARYWMFAGGLTDVNVVVTVTDTHTGVVRSYANPQGSPFQPIQDTSAFPTCP